MCVGVGGGGGLSLSLSFILETFDIQERDAVVLVSPCILGADSIVCISTVCSPFCN